MVLVFNQLHTTHHDTLDDGHLLHRHNRERLRLDLLNAFDRLDFLKKVSFWCKASAFPSSKVVSFQGDDHFEIMASTTNDSLHAFETFDFLHRGELFL